jgi:uncharacterized damage-inducible protein DinB
MATDATALKEAIFGDLERELRVTRTVLERVPAEHFGWRPHQKSMTLLQLGQHVAYMPDWIRATFAADELDAGSAPRPPAEMNGTPELLAHFDRNAAAMREAIARFDMANWERDWTMRNGAQVIVARPRPMVYRLWCVNHMVHHRGQLCLYLRLLDVPVPTVYFNTADDPNWVFE